MKARSVDVAGAIRARQVLAELPAREAAELPVRRRKASAEEKLLSFREMLEAGRTR
jgi:hypothetical protein